MKKSYNILYVIYLLFLLSNSVFSQVTPDTLPDFSIINMGSISTFGASWGDYDNDGYDDLFVGNMDGPNQLYKNNNGALLLLDTGVIVTDPYTSMSACWGDYDNNGTLDLMVANGQVMSFDSERNVLYKNCGGEYFERVEVEPFIRDTNNTLESTFIDFDRDGDLDIYLGNYQWFNILIENQGNSTFKKVQDNPLGMINTSCLGISWGDMNNDFNMDLFESLRWNSLNYLFMHDGETSYYQNLSTDLSKDISSGTGGSWGDYNNDGYLDLLMSNDDYNINFLLKNDKGLNLERVKTGIVATDPQNSYSSAWLDIDNDGDLDLYVTNTSANNLYLNLGNENFYKVSSHPLIQYSNSDMCCAYTDMDNDGDLDIFVGSNNSNTNYLYVNEGNTNNWLKVNLSGSCSNKSAIGAKVRIKANIRGKSYWQMRQLEPRSGKATQSSMILHFGLGKASIVDSLIIEWPSGNRCNYSKLEIDTTYSFYEIDCMSDEFNGDFSIEDVSICAYADANIRAPKIDLPVKYFWQYYRDGEWLDFEESDKVDIHLNLINLYDVKPNMNNTKIRCLAINTCTDKFYYTNEANLRINPCFTLGGTVFTKDDLLDDGIVILEPNIPEEKNDTTSVENGQFLFSNVKEGDYFVYIVPLGDDKETFYSTYNYKSITKENASTIYIDNNMHDLFFLCEKKCSNTQINSISFFESGIVNLENILNENASFGNSIDTIGDLNNNGIMDWIVSAPKQEINEDIRGKIYLLFPNIENELDSIIELAPGSFSPNIPMIANKSTFSRVVNIGDLNNDNINEFAFSVPALDFHRGAIFTFFMDQTGRVTMYNRIGNNEITEGVSIPTEHLANLGSSSMTCLGDLDNDNVFEIAAGATYFNRFYIIYLNQNGATKAYKKIESGVDNFNPEINVNARFSQSITLLSDIDNNGYLDLAVGACCETEDDIACGAVYILFMGENETIINYSKISKNSFNTGFLNEGDWFGETVKYVGDFLQNGKPCIAVTAPYSDHYAYDKGKVIIMSLNNDGTVHDYSVLHNMEKALDDNPPGGYYQANSIIRYDKNNTPTLYCGACRADGKNGINVGKVFEFSFCNDNSIVPYITVTGSVLADNNRVTEGTIELYQSGFYSSPVLTTEIINGQFVFNNIQEGNYVFCANPPDYLSGIYSRTCFTSSLEPSKAKSIPVINDYRNINISLIRSNEMSVSGDNKLNNEILLYPNPVISELNIKCSTQQFISSIEISNLVGQIVLQENIDLSINNYSVNLTEIPLGTYLVKVILEEGVTKIYRIIKL